MGALHIQRPLPFPPQMSSRRVLILSRAFARSTVRHEEPESPARAVPARWQGWTRNPRIAPISHWAALSTAVAAPSPPAPRRARSWRARISSADPSARAFPPANPWWPLGVLVPVHRQRRDAGIRATLICSRRPAFVVRVGPSSINPAAGASTMIPSRQSPAECVRAAALGGGEISSTAAPCSAIPAGAPAAAVYLVVAVEVRLTVYTLNG